MSNPTKKAAPRGKTPKTSSFAEYLEAQMRLSDRTQKEMAEELGYENPNIMTMFKKGLTKVPITKLPQMADTLGIDRVHLLRLGLKEYAPEVWETIEEVMGYPMAQYEREIVDIVRETVGQDTPKMTAEARRLFREAAKALKN